MSEFANNNRRSKYSAQFKDQVLERAAKDGVKRTAQDLALAESMIYSRRAKREQGQAPLEVEKLQQAELTCLVF